MGAVGTGAPWFLNGWAEGTEVEFMIDTECSCDVGIWVDACGRPSVTAPVPPVRPAVVSANSSPLMVHGELCMSVAFPGLRCDMTLVIGSIGSTHMPVVGWRPIYIAAASAMAGGPGDRIYQRIGGRTARSWNCGAGFAVHWLSRIRRLWKIMACLLALLWLTRLSSLQKFFWLTRDDPMW